MKRLFAVALVIAFVAAPFVLAGEAAAPAAPAKKEAVAKEKVDLKELTVKGTVVKEEETNAKGEKVVKYQIKTEDGKMIMVPKGKDSDVDLEPFVGQAVTVKGKGVEKQDKIQLKRVISVEPVEGEAQPPAPEAAPAEPPAAPAAQ